ncbi:UNVERIFIED_CONTAM: hypothetical protein Sradi_2345400 [Sesamum radiatum]|uniref:Uncharacterized protein n=1 Tax=Sesamum radiatum TaxID=300843 RepID=A0AAW2T8Q2_SESRA
MRGDGENTNKETLKQHDDPSKMTKKANGGRKADRALDSGRKLPKVTTYNKARLGGYPITEMRGGRGGYQTLPS